MADSRGREEAVVGITPGGAARSSPSSRKNRDTSRFAVTVTIPLVLFAVVLLVGCFLRLQGLERMAYHHDESIHAFYSWKLFKEGFAATKGQPSHYDPTYHGPFLYQFGALFFLLFGDNDITGRLPFATIGILAIVLAWLLFKERELSWQTALIAAGLIAISPSLTYFARFARNDVYISTWNLGMVVFAYRYFRRLKASDFLLMCLFSVLAYSTKENSYMGGAMLCGFAVIYGICRMALDRREWVPRVLDDYSEFTKLVLLYGFFSVFMFLYAAWYQYSTLDAGAAAPRWAKMVVGVSFMRQIAAGHITRVTEIWWGIFFFLLTLLFVGLGYLRFLFPSGRTLPGTNSYRAAIPSAVWFLALVIWGLFMMEFAGMSLLWAGAAVVAVIAVVAGCQFLFGLVLGDGTVNLDTLTSILRRNLLLVCGLLVIFFVYTYLFTTGFVDVVNAQGQGKNGIVDGALQYLAYWFKIQDAPRLKGPPTYWIWRLFVYEPLFVFVGIWALMTTLAVTVQNFYAWTFYSAGARDGDAVDVDEETSVEPARFLPTFVRSNGCPVLGWTWLPYIVGFALTLLVSLGIHMWAMQGRLSLLGVILTIAPAVVYVLFLPQIVRERGMYAFLLFWSMASVGIYSQLHERAPWLLVHQTLPLVLLSGLFLSDFLRHVRMTVVRYALLVPVFLLGAYEIHSNLLLSFYYPDDAREMLVYTQTNPKILGLVREMEELAQHTGAGDETRFAVSGEANWPMTWYLRNYKNVYWSMPNNKDYPIVIADETKKTRMERVLGADYYFREYPIRSWWQPELADLRQDQQRWRKIWKYLIYRETWSPQGHSLVHVYRDYDPFERLNPPDIPEIPFTTQAPQVLRTIGAQGAGAGQLREPRGVALAGGKLYVSDSKNGRIQVFGLDGTFLATVPDPQGSDQRAQLSTEYSGASDVGVDQAGNVFVADTWAIPQENLGPRGRILKFSPQGALIREWEQPNGFYGPRGLTVNSLGHVWVVDTGNKRIQVFDNNGAHQGTFGTEGAGSGEFVEPVGICVGPEDHVYVADTGNHRIQVFDRNRRFLYEVPLPEEAWMTKSLSIVEPGIAVSAKGSLVVSDSINHCLWIVDNFGREVKGARRCGTYGSRDGQFNSPKGLACDEQGNVYVSDSLNNRVVVLAGFDR